MTFIHSKAARCALILMAVVYGLGFKLDPSNPPGAKTGAPFDGSCADSGCHNPINTSFNGTPTLTGLPTVILPSTTYSLTLTGTVTAGSPTKAGFELVAVSAVSPTYAQAGSFTNGTGTSTTTTGGRSYIRQSAAKNITGGAVSWTFSWKSPATVAGNSVAFYYIVNFCNGNGNENNDRPITASLTLPFNANGAPTASISALTNVSCNGGSNGSATASGSGGTSPYTFAWSNGQSTQTISNLAVGSYTVTVTDANGLTATAIAAITQPAPVTAAITANGTISCVNPSFVATVATTGGNPPFTYQWSTGSLFNYTNVTAPGSLSVTVTDAGGCTKSASTTISGNTNAPTAAAAALAQITCVNPNVTVSGAGSSTGPAFAYAWSGPGIVTGGTTLTPVVTIPNIYILTVTNTANGCTATASATVTGNTTIPTAEASAGATITCLNPSSSISAATSAANPVFSWLGPNGFTSSSQNLTVGEGGSYFVTVTDPANGCTNAATTSLSQNTAAPGATASGATLTCAATSVLINGNSTASPVDFNWTGPNGFTSTEQNPVVSTPGDFTLVVTDPANGCTSTAAATIAQNTAAPVTEVAAPGQLSCNAPTVQLNAAASSQGSEFVYSWFTSDGHIVSGDSTLLPVVDKIGSYNLLITNNLNGCAAYDTVSVDALPGVAATIFSTQAVGCNGGSDGSATVAATGGAGTFSFLWSTGETSATTSGLTAGEYTVTVTDPIGGCAAIATATVGQPDVLTVNATATAETSNGSNDGTATASPAGGAGFYLFLWSNNETTQTITGLAPGAYSVTLLDAKGCTATQTVTVNAFGCNLSATAAATDVTCNGAANGTATVSITGATDPVSYLWSTGATTQTATGLAHGDYFCTATDAGGCPAVVSVSVAEPVAVSASVVGGNITCPGANNGYATALANGGTGGFTYQWSTGATTVSISGLPPGGAYLTVTDVAGCTATAGFTLVEPPVFVSTAASITNNICPDGKFGSIKVNLTGGTPIYTYLWSNGQTTNPATGLPVGSFTVTVTDSNGCTFSESHSVVASDPIPPSIVCLDAMVDGCEGEPVNEQPSGVPMFFDNCSTIGLEPIRTGPWAADHIYPVGTTTLGYSITDASGNVGSCSFVVVVHPKPGITVGAVKNDVGGAGVGSISVTLAGGPFTSTIWKKDGLNFSNNEDLTGLKAGSYVLVVTTVDGCTAQSAPIVVQNTVGTAAVEAASLRISPNPTGGMVFFETEAEISEIRVLDSRGRQVFFEKGNPAEIDLTGMAEGVYFLQIQMDDGAVAVRRVVRI